MRIVLDQNLPRQAALLRPAGWDCVHVGEVSLSLAEDHEIISWAAADSRVCITRDADFHALLATRQATKPSVIRAHETASHIEVACERYREALEAGAFVRITPGKIGCRRLPIGE